MPSESDSKFYLQSTNNQFDNLPVDLDSIYTRFPLEKLATLGIPASISSGLLPRLYRNRLLPLKWRLKLWQLAFRAQLDLDWFEEISNYWVNILGGRPLWSVHDLYFLKNIYRIKFQANVLPDTQDASTHLQAWQRPELLYLLFHLVTKETAIPNARLVRRVRSLLPARQTNRWLEFGCSNAPVVTAAIRFFPDRKIKYYIADLQSLTFHYAAYSLRQHSRVTPLLLKPEKDFALELSEKLDVIFCIQVFEHLNRPLETAKQFYELLPPGGLLVFDFMMTDGKGLDTHQAVTERNQVLDFIQEKFEIVAGGPLDPTRTIEETIARKK